MGHVHRLGFEERQFERLDFSRQRFPELDGGVA